jgi:hypothetical protein
MLPFTTARGTTTMTGTGATGTSTIVITMTGGVTRSTNGAVTTIERQTGLLTFAGVL